MAKWTSVLEGMVIEADTSAKGDRIVIYMQSIND